MGNFLSDGFGDTAYQMKKYGGKGDLSQQLVTSKLEEKYGKNMVDAIVQGDWITFPNISKQRSVQKCLRTS